MSAEKEEAARAWGQGFLGRTNRTPDQPFRLFRRSTEQQRIHGPHNEIKLSGERSESAAARC